MKWARLIRYHRILQKMHALHITSLWIGLVNACNQACRTQALATTNDIVPKYHIASI